MVAAALTGLGSAFPSRVSQELLWERFFARQYRADRAAERIWRRSGVAFRHGVAVPPDDDVSGWGTEARMRRFQEEARPLGRDAVRACLAHAGLDPGTVDLLVLVTCTGYGAPGVDVTIARDLGMPQDLQRLLVGHMGCHAALPALAALSDAVAARGLIGVLACVELCSLHLQRPDGQLDQVVAHALFSDAAAAAAMVPEGRGLALLDVASRNAPELAALMTWDVTDHGFRMGLSPDVPRALDRHVADAVGKLLAAHGLAPPDVAAWAVHPGGPRVLDVVADRLGLADEQLVDSASILRDHGNCSSATVLLVLQRILERRDLADGDHVVSVAFGPGLTLAAALLRKTG